MEPVSQKDIDDKVWLSCQSLDDGMAKEKRRLNSCHRVNTRSSWTSEDGHRVTATCTSKLTEETLKEILHISQGKLTDGVLPRYKLTIGRIIDIEHHVKRVQLQGHGSYRSYLECYGLYMCGETIIPRATPQLLGEYVGKVRRFDEYEAERHPNVSKNLFKNSFMDFNKRINKKKLGIDADVHCNCFRYINSPTDHTKGTTERKANVTFEEILIDNWPHTFVFVKSDTTIKTGEELFASYGPDYSKQLKVQMAAREIVNESEGEIRREIERKYEKDLEAMKKNITRECLENLKTRQKEEFLEKAKKSINDLVKEAEACEAVDKLQELFAEYSKPLDYQNRDINGRMQKKQKIWTDEFDDISSTSSSASSAASSAASSTASSATSSAGSTDVVDLTQSSQEREKEDVEYLAQSSQKKEKEDVLVCTPPGVREQMKNRKREQMEIGKREQMKNRKRKKSSTFSSQSDDDFE